MLLPSATLHFTGGFCPSATPDAPGPRNEGQFCAAAAAARTPHSATDPMGRDILLILSHNRRHGLSEIAL